MDERLWWVNHSRTHRHEIAGAYLWFAKRPLPGKARSEPNRDVGGLLPGDIVISCADGAVGAAGVVLGAARESARPPDFDSMARVARADAKRGGSDAGWLAPVRFMPLARRLLIVDHIVELAPVLPKSHAPIRANGTANPNVPLAALPPPMSAALRRLLGDELESAVAAITAAVGRSLVEASTETRILRRTDIGPAIQAGLLSARHGLGLFRTNVESVESACRVTGVLDRRHLRASHIKPWCECSDSEMLDGCNGLLLAPHVAHLFERGYISFSDAGELLISQELNPAVVESWHIGPPGRATGFAPAQCNYLDHHRRKVFEQHGGGRRSKSAGHFDPLPELLERSVSAEPVTVNPA